MSRLDSKTRYHVYVWIREPISCSKDLEFETLEEAKEFAQNLKIKVKDNPHVTIHLWEVTLTEKHLEKVL